MHDVIWFNTEMLPLLDGYSTEYRSFKNGDFGDLERVELEGNNKGVTLDFWSSGWIGIHLIDYLADAELLNVLLEPNQDSEKDEAFKKLKSILKN